MARAVNGFDDRHGESPAVRRPPFNSINIHMAIFCSAGVSSVYDRRIDDRPVGRCGDCDVRHNICYAFIYLDNDALRRRGMPRSIRGMQHNGDLFPISERARVQYAKQSVHNIACALRHRLCPRLRPCCGKAPLVQRLQVPHSACHHHNAVYDVAGCRLRHHSLWRGCIPEYLHGLCSRIARRVLKMERYRVCSIHHGGCVNRDAARRLCMIERLRRTVVHTI